MKVTCQSIIIDIYTLILLPSILKQLLTKIELVVYQGATID